MKAVYEFLPTLLAIIGIAQAISIKSLNNHVVDISLKKTLVEKPAPKIERSIIKGHLENDFASISVNIQDFHQYAYLTNLTIGNPPQTLTFCPDTGSYFPVVYDIANSQHKDGFLHNAGFYDPSRSTTSNVTQYESHLVYGMGYAKGTWATDVFRWGNTIIKKMDFLDATNTTLNYALLGLRPVARNDKSNSQSDNKSHGSIVSGLVAEGYIKSEAYSIYLNHVSSRQGSLQFGGIDTTKFIPPLYSVNTTTGSSDHLIRLSGIYSSFSPYQNLIDPSDDQDLLGNTLLDTGTSYSFLQPTIIDRIARSFSDSYYDDVYGLYIVPCDTSDSLIFSFSGAKIILAGQQIAHRYLGTTDRRCFLPFRPITKMNHITSDGVVLGQSFLEAAYVVFNSPDGVVGLAQANPSQETVKNLVPIIPGEGIPGSIPAPGE